MKNFKEIDSMPKKDINITSEEEEVKIFILNSRKCSWGKCIFCGYGKIYGIKTKDEILKRIDNFFQKEFKKNHKIKEIRVFGSGSFLDEKQIPKEVRRYFIEKCKKNNIKGITIESRPEFVSIEKLKEFNGLNLRVAIGLEIADNKILRKIKKGFSLNDFEKAVNIIHNANAKVRTYLLVNLPFVKNIKKSLTFSVKYAEKFSDSIVLINLLPHKNAKLMELWLRGEWNFLSREEFFKLTEKFRKNPKIEFDVETFHFVPQFPKNLRKRLVGVGEEFLVHPYYEVWQDYLQRWYKPPKEKDILLFLSCSYKKPYSKSETHRKILKKLEKVGRRKIHEVMLSSPGVIPREFENLYPFNAYDWDEKLETEEIKERYIEVTAERIENYLRFHKNSYRKIFCFLKYDSESYKALQKACNKLKLNFENLLRKETYKKIKMKGESKVLQNDEALNDLYEGLNKYLSHKSKQ